MKIKLTIAATVAVASHDAIRFALGAVVLGKLKRENHELFNGPAALASVQACLADYESENA